MLKNLTSLLLILLLTSCSYLGTEDEPAPEKETITGRVYFMGNEPFINLGLNAFDGRVFALLADDDDMKALSEYQNKIVNIVGYVDKKIKYPQNSIIVEEYNKVDIGEVSGRLYKEGRGIRAHYYLQSKEMTYEVITENSIILEKYLNENVKMSGYIYAVRNSIDNIFELSVEKEELDEKEE